MLWLNALLAFALAHAALRFLLSRFGTLALDEPNARSLHERPVPRTGGIGVLAGASVAPLLGAGELWLPFSLALGLAAISFFDDLHAVPRAARLAAHFLAAGMLVWYLFTPMHPAELAALIVAAVWVTNLYNFMDGADGIAGGMAAIGFGAYAAAAGAAGQVALTSLSLALCAASIAFLLYNFHPARLFLGDVGAIPLGFLAGGLGLQGWRDDAWPLWFPVLVFGPFIADATVTLLKRAIKREAVWHAHLDHYYQRMVRMGLGHRRTAWAGYAAMLVCAAASLYARAEPAPVQALAFAAASLVLAGMAAWVDLRWSRFVREKAM